MMRTRPHSPPTKGHNRTAIALLALLLAGCGKDRDEEPTPSPGGAQSTEGGILESARKTADEANARTRKVQEEVDAARQRASGGAGE